MRDILSTENVMELERFFISQASRTKVTGKTTFRMEMARLAAGLLSTKGILPREAQTARAR